MVTSERAQIVPMKRLLSIRELTNKYGATTWYWRTAIWSGKLPVVVAGRKQLVDIRDVEAFIEKHKK